MPPGGQDTPQENGGAGEGWLGAGDLEEWGAAREGSPSAFSARLGALPALEAPQLAAHTFRRVFKELHMLALQIQWHHTHKSFLCLTTFRK